MELLRIITMLMIMIQHANFKVIGIPLSVDIMTMPISSFMRFFMQSLCFIGVNVFVMLSGWYGILFRVERLLGFIFQVLFFSVLVYGVLFLGGYAPMLPPKRWLFLLTMQNYWFVVAYLLLYILSPVLNAFVEATSSKTMKNVLLLLFACELLLGWMPSAYPSYISGFSPLHFFALYLLARYMKEFQPLWTQMNKYRDIMVYLLVSLLISLAALISEMGGAKTSSYLYKYSSPLCIASALFFILAFSKMSVQSKLVNIVATSCFAVYLVHDNPYFCYAFYMPLIKEWFTTQSTVSFILLTGIWILFLFLASILLDQIRLRVWKIIKNRIQADSMKL
jgi:surface polysaccharide O-acyltransferase-like enzyme